MIKIFSLLIFSCSCFFSFGQQPPTAIGVMTYNIRYHNAGDTGSISWNARKSFILSTIKYHKADIIGMQEVLKDQLHYFDSALTGFGHVGIGREDGKEKGEYAPVFFNASKFEKIKDSTFWLSPTPQKVSKGWDAALERICTWVELKNKRTGKIFFVFNTHFDHIGVKAREESARLVISKIKLIAGNNPVILTGDFNTPENSAPLTIVAGINDDGTASLFDAKITSALPHHGPDKTFCGFNLEDGIIGDRIDYIFVSQQFFVLTHATLTDFKGDHFPSDHFPVFSQMQLRD